jgi:predicted amidohydrolase
MNDESRKCRIAVIQLAVEVGEVDRNLRHIADLVSRCAREHDPDLILLPESMTTQSVFHPAMRAVARPVDGEPFQLLRRLAREHGCLVGGGFIAARAGQAKGTYVLAEPDGSAHLHDKDQPTLWDNYYYVGGDDDGFCLTSLGPVGLANGFEWCRSRTARRLRGSVRLIAGGSCWWSFPDWGVTRRWLGGREHDYNLAMAREMVGRMARVLGAPAAIAQHVGPTAGYTPGLARVPWRTVMVGESQICERDGRMLARMALEDGEGYVAADVTLAEPEPVDAVPHSFWMPVLPASFHVAWAVQNMQGRAGYRRAMRRGEFTWQSLPEGDLPNYVPPDQQAAATLPGETQSII